MDCSVFDFTVCANLVWCIHHDEGSDILETPEHLQNVFKLAICSMTPFRGTPR